MGYVRYVLSQTGLFPRWEPNAASALEAAGKISEIKDEQNGYYYILSDRYNLSYLCSVFEIFASNGVILRPYKSKDDGRFVFRVPNNGQQFIKDVKHLNEHPWDESYSDKPSGKEAERTKYCREYVRTRRRQVLFSRIVNRIKRR